MQRSVNLRFQQMSLLLHRFFPLPPSQSATQVFRHRPSLRQLWPLHRSAQASQLQVLHRASQRPVPVGFLLHILFPTLSLLYLVPALVYKQVMGMSAAAFKQYRPMYQQPLLHPPQRSPFLHPLSLYHLEALLSPSPPVPLELELVMVPVRRLLHHLPLRLNYQPTSNLPNPHPPQ